MRVRLYLLLLSRVFAARGCELEIFSKNPKLYFVAAQLKMLAAIRIFDQNFS